ncbi:MAG TPA: anti-sigma factor [Candidatus Cybelea sp.]|nr:anti-sigma factor [Candidatus Cybelea sp.]
MSDRIHEFLDDVAVYALGAMPAAEAQRVRDHMATCAECREEYALLKAAVAAVGQSAETPAADAPSCPSTLLKPRIMRAIRETIKPAVQAVPTSPARDNRSILRPAYLVAAACLAIAVVSSITDIVLTGQLKQAQTEIARLSTRSTTLAANLADTRTTLADLVDADSKHYPINGGEVVTHVGRVYVAMHELPQLPHGKVYQAWTLAKGAKKVAPSVTFVPNARGVAVIAIPIDARSTAAVALSVEPEGGSKQPTTKPIALVPLT